MGSVFPCKSPCVDLPPPRSAALPPPLSFPRHPPIAFVYSPDHQIKVFCAGEVPHCRVLHAGWLGRAHDIIELRAALPKLQDRHRADRDAETATTTGFAASGVFDWSQLAMAACRRCSSARNTPPVFLGLPCADVRRLLCQTDLVYAQGL